MRAVLYWLHPYIMIIMMIKKDNRAVGDVVLCSCNSPIGGLVDVDCDAIWKNCVERLNFGFTAPDTWIANLLRPFDPGPGGGNRLWII